MSCPSFSLPSIYLTLALVQVEALPLGWPYDQSSCHRGGTRRAAPPCSPSCSGAPSATMLGPSTETLDSLGRSARGQWRCSHLFLACLGLGSTGLPIAQCRRTRHCHRRPFPVSKGVHHHHQSMRGSEASALVPSDPPETSPSTSSCRLIPSSVSSLSGVWCPLT
jgi:hypothetical protein